MSNRSLYLCAFICLIGMAVVSGQSSSSSSSGLSAVAGMSGSSSSSSSSSGMSSSSSGMSSSSSSSGMSSSSSSSSGMSSSSTGGMSSSSSGVSVISGVTTNTTVCSTCPVQSPMQGDKWLLGGTFTITWLLTGNFTTGLTSFCDIYLLNNGGSPNMIASSVPNTGSYTWIISTDTASTSSAQVEIVSKNVTNANIVSSPFTTSKPAAAMILSPLAGTVWVVGNTYTITWTIDGALCPCIFSNVTIRLIWPGTTWVIVNNTKNTGSYQWTITNGTYLGTNSQVQIIANNDEQALSPKFTTAAAGTTTGSSGMSSSSSSSGMSGVGGNNNYTALLTCGSCTNAGGIWCGTQSTPVTSSVFAPLSKNAHSHSSRRRSSTLKPLAVANTVGMCLPPGSSTQTCSSTFTTTSQCNGAFARFGLSWSMLAFLVISVLASMNRL